MAKFLYGDELNSELGKIFENAQEKLILISPFIKLQHRYLSILESKKEKPELKIIIVFGKNEDDLSKSMKQDDLNFFKQFPNIEIRYEKRLHAKYYANEESAILTSMNLYNYSQENNIEAGILTSTKSVLESIASDIKKVTGIDTFERQAAVYFDRVIEQSELLFKKVPKFESKWGGLQKVYTESVIETNKLSDSLNDKIKSESFIKKDNYVKPEPSKQMGFCIRTGVQIPFNQKLPMSDSAHQSWKKFNNPDYPEKYCHFSGEPSNGETTFSKPILRKNWIKAKEIHNL